jgi:hypothetical protein
MQTVLSDMIGSRIEYIHARPYAYSDIVATGTITELYEDKSGKLHFRVQPDKAHLLPKWRTEDDLLKYLHEAPETRTAMIAVETTTTIAA